MLDTLEKARAFALGWKDGERGGAMVPPARAEDATLPEGLTFESIPDSITAYRLGYWVAFREAAGDTAAYARRCQDAASRP